MKSVFYVFKSAATSVAEVIVNMGNRVSKASTTNILNELDLYRPDIFIHLNKSGHYKSMGYLELGKYGPFVAVMLAKDSSMCTLNISDNELRMYGPAVADALSTAPHLHTVYIAENELEQYGIKTAFNLAKSPSLRIVHMGCNGFTNDQVIQIARIFLYRENPIKLGIDDKFHQLIREAISGDNHQMHIPFEQAMSDTFGCTAKPLLALIEGYADYDIEFIV